MFKNRLYMIKKGFIIAKVFRKEKKCEYIEKK